jgi:hypothetical protein
MHDDRTRRLGMQAGSRNPELPTFVLRTIGVRYLANPGASQRLAALRAEYDHEHGEELLNGRSRHAD